MKIRIPKEFRQGGRLARNCIPGLDLPAYFLDNIQSIDPNIYPVFHQYRIIWDDIQNSHTGEIEDPRFHIGYYPGFSIELWGYPLKDLKDNPIEEPAWHLWRKSQVGWSHIVKIESKDPFYLNILTRRLHLQALYREKYGNLAWNKKMREDEEAAREKEIENQNQTFQDIQKENKGFIRKAMEEFERGNVNPTNATKEIICSYSGQKNRTKIVRPITDKEGGLIDLN